MLIDIQTVYRKQDETHREAAQLRQSLPKSEDAVRRRNTRLEALQEAADFLHLLSLVHACLDRGDKENSSDLRAHRPPDSDRLYILSGDPRPFLSRQALLEVSLVAGPSKEGKRPALYYLYQARHGALAVMAGIHSLPRDYLVAENAASPSAFSASDLLNTFCVYPQRVGQTAFVFRSFPIWLPDSLSAQHLEECVFQFFCDNLPRTDSGAWWDHPNFHRVGELMRMGWWERLNLSLGD